MKHDAAPPPPAHAVDLVGEERLPLAERYAALLATDGVVRGLIGPRETPRLWDRHLINCALLARAIPTDASVADIGSGAGLPGIVLAIVRPDLRITLIEPLLRRTTFLEEVVDELGLDHVQVHRGRAESLAGDRRFDVVTSRAVAPLGRLLTWSMPLVAPTGHMVAMKGSSVADEIADAADVVAQLRLSRPEVEFVPVHAGGTPGPVEAADGDLDGAVPSPDGIHVVRVGWADPGNVSLPRSSGTGRASAGGRRSAGSSGRRHSSGGGRRGGGGTGSGRRRGPRTD
ncbi:16S rRNA (guanine(527)-N(7))-methyltransferase RsmG [Nocardioides sp.]|uniref:16S rRNA (guanine(527)-N(7))-methyltransferase RsmG n=1 Tax=Nocardioides sp. TaxID=35761 RepID=UPI0035193AE6